ncbi:hypothetical protein VFPFJ_11226 [Purpureocillium lilacinum]|uniref:Uncharacterized protein n=1 Tax=Purpureocillium lilacinum TaxID=33203 RepID=A0A179FK91_PURLI|nr:hypothetical protein VFPFJ_11226 [Purpureocillium lilacinum]OAQ65691.1 hypothetical protein VFPFJ_11226 [Purpureocillium lilacinum]
MFDYGNGLHVGAHFSAAALEQSSTPAHHTGAGCDGAAKHVALRSGHMAVTTDHGTPRVPKSSGARQDLSVPRGRPLRLGPLAQPTCPCRCSC